MDKLSLEARIKAEAVGFSGRVAVYANDFKGNVISIDAQEEFESASCIKSYILAEFYRRVHMGGLDRNELLEYTQDNYVTGSGILKGLDTGVRLTAKNFATLMIIVSDNVATNIMIDLLGLDNINKTCRDLGFADTTLHNKLDFEKYKLLGTTTPQNYGRLFEMIAQGQLWSAEISQEMVEILRKQHYNRMLTKNMAQYLAPEDDGEELIYIASKSGSMNACRNDGGIVYTPYGNYVVVVFTKEFSDPLYYNDHESYHFGARISRLLFDQYIAREGSF